MKNILNVILIFILVICSQQLFAQTQKRDKGIFTEEKDEFLEYMKKSAEEAKKEEPAKKEFKMDFTGLDIPASVGDFQKSWYSEPISQGMTGGCWAFSSVSFFESEVYRLTQKKVKLSEMYTIYWEYVEKAKRFVEERGDSVFSKGSQPNATKRIWEKYGIVPAELYPGKKPEQKFFDHTKMYEEMKAYLESVKERSEWNKEIVIGTIRSIMNTYIGVPPMAIVIDGKQITPKDYLDKVLQLKLDDYVDVMSLMGKPYYQKVEYEVADNWWHNTDYYNVPVEDFMKIIKGAVRKGYTICIVGDTSEPGYYPQSDVAMIPTYDIPSEYIDDNARQMRFSTESTTDDHAIHLVGYLEKGGKDWFLIKDSGSSAWNGENKGYFFFHEDYVKLKMMNLLLHKSVVEEMLGKSIQ